MASFQDGFDAKKMRREIFEARNTDIWMVLDFIKELARVLTQKGRQHDFVYIADRLVGLLQGNSKCDVECEGMLKYYIEFEELLSNCAVRIDILIKIGKRYLETACYEKTIEYMLKADKLADELKEKAPKIVCFLYLGLVYECLANYDKAIDYYNRSLVISIEIGDRSTIAENNASLGSVYVKMGEYEKGIDYFNKWLPISTELMDQSETATCCRMLGIAYSSIGQYKTAIEYHDKGLAISSKIGDRLGVAINNSDLGFVYFCLGQNGKAILHFEKGLEISTELCFSIGIAKNSQNLGNLYMRVGQYAKAIKYFNQNRAISTETGNRSGIGVTCGNLGVAYLHMGQCSKAVEHCNEALAISTEIGGRSAIAFNNDILGDAYTTLGQFEKAIEYLKRALAINSEIGERSGRACNCCRLGDVYNRLGQYEKAVEYLNESLAISSEIGNQLLIANGNRVLGLVYSNMKQYKEAIECQEKSLKVSIEIRDPLGIARSCQNLGCVYQNVNNYEKAIEYLNKALASSYKIGSPPEILCVNVILGNAYHNLGNYEKAITSLQKSYEFSVDIGDHLTESMLLGFMGQSYMYLALSRLRTCEAEALTKLQHAVSLIQKSVQGLDQVFLNLSVDENKISFNTTGQLGLLYVSLMHCFILLKRMTAALLVIDLGKAKALLAFIEKRKKLGIVDHMAYYVHEIWRKIDHSEEDMQVDDFRKAIQLKENNSTILFYSFDHGKFLNIWVLNAEGRVRYEISSQDLNLPEDYIFRKLEMFLKAHFVELSRDSSMYKLDSDSSFEAQLKIAEIRWSQISFNDKFVDAKEKSSVSDLENSKNMHLQKSHSYNSIFLHNIPENSELKMEKLVEVVQRYDLAIDLARLRSPVGQSSVNCSNTAETSAILQALFQALIHPVKKFIKGTKLIIVPDKFLFFAPFCALLDENSCPMSEHYSVQITLSLQTLYCRMKEPHDASLGFALFVGNPTVGEVSFCGESLYLSELPNATIEARLLASRFDAKPLVEGEAIKQRVLKCILDASIIHIAAHGDRERGEIFLAPNPSSSLPKEESYLLKEKDILNSKINAKLVVLCCCHTGSGQTCSEGVVGLARAFLAAGARSVLAALWRIHDAGTKVFMEKFYDEICNETSVCEALRRAMNMLRRHENHFYRDVQIWAPFIIYGEDVKFSRQDIDEIKRKSRDMTM